MTDKEQYNKRNVQPEDGGNYSCVMSAPAGRARASLAISLSVLAPPTVNIRSESQDILEAAGLSAMLSMLFAPQLNCPYCTHLCAC